MVPNADLYPVELRIVHSQVGVGNVRPSAADFHCLAAPPHDPNAAASTHREVEGRRISRRKVVLRPNSAARQLDIRAYMSPMHTRIPPQNHRFKSPAEHGLRTSLIKEGNQTYFVFEAASSPPAADFIGQNFACGKPGSYYLRLGKRIRELFTGFRSRPYSEIPVMSLRLGNAGLRASRTPE